MLKKFLERLRLEPQAPLEQTAKASKKISFSTLTSQAESLANRVPADHAAIEPLLGIVNLLAESAPHAPQAVAWAMHAARYSLTGSKEAGLAFMTVLKHVDKLPDPDQELYLKQVAILAIVDFSHLAWEANNKLASNILSGEPTRPTAPRDQKSPGAANKL